MVFIKEYSCFKSKKVVSYEIIDFDGVCAEVLERVYSFIEELIKI